MWRVPAAAAFALTACGPPPVPPMRPLPPVSAGKVSVRVFTEPAAVRAVAALGDTTLVATDNGLERWSDAHATIVPPLEGRRVTLLAADRAGLAAWVMTDGTLGRFDLASNTYAVVTDELDEPVTAVADAGDGLGAWLGGAHGLVYASRAAAPHVTAAPLVKDAVRALVRAPDGTLYAATAAGLVARRASGEVVHLGPAQGCTLAEARLVVDAPGDRVIAFGVDDAGHDRIAIGDLRGFTTFRALPDIHVDRAARRGNGVIAIAGDHAYRIAAADGSVRPLAREGTRLVAITSPEPEAASPENDGSADSPEPAMAAPHAAQPSWSIDAVDLVLPAGATVLAGSAVDDSLLVGTRDLGVGRLRDGDRHARDWLRARAMFADATTLSVACAGANDCWIATGARVGWHWTGDQFTAFAPEGAAVLGVIRDPAASGGVYAIERDADDPGALRIAPVGGRGTGVTVRLRPLAEDRAGSGDESTSPSPSPSPSAPAASGASTPAATNEHAPDRGDRADHADRPPDRTAELVFARFAAPGTLWIGLRDATATSAAASTASPEIVVVDLATGTATARPAASAPAHVADADLRGTTAWFATSAGVVRAAGDKLTVWTERDGLRSELVRAVSIAPSGNAVIGTRDGVGIFDGRAWTFPPALRFEVNDLVATRSGLWLASERGLVAWDGKNLRRFDTLRGLAENEVLDVAVDTFGRIWARGPTSLTLLTR